MKQMEGACRFCGQIQTVQAESKDEANRIATLNCNCDEAEAYRRKEDLLALIDQTCADLPKDSGFMSMTTSQLKAMHELGCMIADGHVGKITVDVSDSRCMISKKKDGSFTFKRNKVLCLGGTFRNNKREIKIKISTCTQLPMNADAELIKSVEELKFRKLMIEAVSAMEPGRWYAVKLDRAGSPEFGFGIDGMVLRSSLTVTPASEKTAVYISPEDMFLKNNVQVSFWEKIKNCIKYLRDKSGGAIKWKGKDDE